MKKQIRNPHFVIPILLNVFFLVIILLSFTSCCGEEASASQETPWVYQLTRTTAEAQYTFFVDPSTGVHYIVIQGRDGIAVTPRLNTDGSLYTGQTGMGVRVR